MYLEAAVYVVMGAAGGFLVGFIFNRLRLAQLSKKLKRAEYEHVRRDFRILELEAELKEVKDSVLQSSMKLKKAL